LVRSPQYLEDRARKAELKLNDDWITLIADNIRRLVENGPLPVEAMVTDVHGTTLGLAREKHLIRAWDQLTDEGVVLPRDKKQKPRRQTIYPVRR
jgi:hypothetical protein